MNWIKVDEEIFDHVGKRISESDIETIADCSLSTACVEVLQCKYNWIVD
jgi:hypothetical protein